MTAVSTRPVVLIHGVGLDATMWQPVLSTLGDTALVAHCYDMLGHGSRADNVGPFTIDDFVEQLEFVRAELAVPTIDVVGFSMGALVAQAYASRYPHQVNRLIVLNGVYNRSEPERAAAKERVSEARRGGYAATIDAALHRWFSPAFWEGQREIVDAVRTRMESNNQVAFANAYEVFATADEGLRDQLPLISCPTLVVTSAGDSRSTPAMAEAMAAVIPVARAVIIPHARHMTPLECPATVAHLIEEFLR